MKQFNVRLDDKTVSHIRALQSELGVSQADVIRLAVRLLRRREIWKKKKNPR